MKHRLLALSFTGLAACSVLGGCIVGPVPPASVEVSGYAPLHYDGYVVYYDQWGAPFYYRAGVAYYVPRGYAHYDTLVRHYRRQPEGYRRWYAHDAYRYHEGRYREGSARR